jgi:O-antigen ligase
MHFERGSVDGPTKRDTPIGTWSSQRARISSWRRRLGVASGLDLVLVSFLGVLLIVRVLTDDRSGPYSRYSGSINLSAVIGMLFILLAVCLLLYRRHGVVATVLVALWVCVWVAIAVNTSGASTETLREGVRELSVIALGVIVYNARGAVTVPIATRLVQLVGFAPAILALYQIATHTGMEVGQNLRANGTFAHPNSVAMFFGIAATASLWRYLDAGRRRSDVLLMTLFAAALITTFSIDGLITLVAMLTTFGALRPGSLRSKLGPCAIAGVVVLVFFAIPLGAQRVASEAPNGETNSTLDTRIHRWKTLLPRWERSPVFGQGLGTTTTTKSTLANRQNYLLPHNEYIRYLVETGIVGLAILLAALTALLRVLFRKLKMSGKPGSGTLNAPALAIAIVVGCLVNSLADNTLLNSPTCYAAVLIVAAVLAMPEIEARRAPGLHAVGTAH